MSKKPAGSAIEKPSKQDTERTEAGSLLRGLTLIELLQSAQRPLTATELAERSGQPLSTVHRLMQVLIRNDYVYRDGSKHYHAGAKALAPLHLYHPLNVLRRDAREHLRTVRDRFRQTSSIAVFLGIERLILELAVEDDSLSPHHETHLRTPLHGAASGKVLLASLPPDELDAVVGSGTLVRRTPHTIGDVSSLRRELDQVRSQGFAIAIDEIHIGLSAAAAPIEVYPGVVIGCLIVSGLTASFDRDKAIEAGKMLKMTADLMAVGNTSALMVASFLGRGPVIDPPN